MEDQLGISYGTCQCIFTEELMMRWITVKYVPRVLTYNQKQQCISVCCDFQEHVQNDPTFLAKIITGDETWVYGYDPRTK
jgi:hypothetical protein